MAEFFHMGGYAFYVWTAYALVLVVLVGNVVAARLGQKRLLERLARRGQGSDAAGSAAGR